MHNRLWVIWSIEHKAWWRAQRLGYTEDPVEAGQYSFDEACDIVCSANYVHISELPREAMIPLSALTASLEDQN